ncbi:MAG: GntR family transcriptional regulator [Terriglobia bacterium]
MGNVSISISQSSSKPIYRQIEDKVRALIVAGELGDGEELPSIRTLARDLRVSVLTVKRAYDDLEAEGFLTSVQGKGCYVSVRNKELFREQRMRNVEEKLDDAASEAKLIGMTLEELQTMLAIVFEEEKHGTRVKG